MGMFDNIRYKDHEYQTKDTPSQTLDNYEIREDGTLWHEEYDTEWVEDEGSLFGGYLKQYNQRWKFCNYFDGDIRFYRHSDKAAKEWIEYRSLFLNGKLINIIEV